MGRKPLPETLVLRDILAAAKPGEVITYAAMEQHIGRDPRVGGLLNSAKDWLHRRKGIQFRSYNNIGLVRLHDGPNAEMQQMRADYVAVRNARLSAPPAADWVRPDPREPDDEFAKSVRRAEWGLFGMLVAVAMALIIAAVL
jgi:hypothetical protein